MLKCVLLMLTIKAVYAKIPWQSACGVTQGCFPDCQGGCDYLVTWQLLGSTLTFNLYAETTDQNYYLAIGFSNDYRMGEDSVVACLPPPSSTVVQALYNEDTDSEVLAPQPTFTLPSISYTSGTRSCSFQRTISSSDSRFYDLNKDYILMLVMGEMETEHGGYKIATHHMIPWSSDRKVDFNSNNIYGLYKLNSPRVKLHGIMMMLAWLMFCGIGIVTARYNKDMLSGRKLFGTKIWFQVHRGLMIAVVVCVIIGFIPIFVEIEGFSQIAPEKGKDAVAAHPVLGIIVTALAFVNPIMSIFRPNPDHKYRFIFNWGHRSVGVVAQILAVVVVFMGYVLQRSMLPASSIYITIVNVCLTAIVCVVLEVLQWQTLKKTKEQIELSNDKAAREGMVTEPKDTSGSRLPHLPFYILLAYTMVQIGLCMGILGVIAAS